MIRSTVVEGSVNTQRRSPRRRRLSLLVALVALAVLALGCEAPRSKHVTAHRPRREVPKSIGYGGGPAPAPGPEDAAPTTTAVPTTTTSPATPTTTASPQPPAAVPSTTVAPTTTAAPATTAAPPASTSPPTTAAPAAPSGGSISPVGAAFGHVVPGSVGSVVGVGVVGGVPSQVYSGSLTVTSPQVIQNVVINGCVNVRSPGVVLRNVVINCSGWHPVGNLDDSYSNGSNVDGLVVEYSRLNCTGGSSLGKMFRFVNARNVTVRNNELVGCDQTFFVNGDVGNMVIEYNVQRDPIISASSHWEVISVGEYDDLAARGSITMRGNWFSAGAHGGGAGITDAVFMPMDGGGNVSLHLESNFLPVTNYYTVRCAAPGKGSCTLAYNVFDTAIRKYSTIGQNLSASVVRCNRFADGALIGADTSNTTGFAGAGTIDNTNCP